MADNHFDINNLNNLLIDSFCDNMPGGYFVYKAGGDERLLYANKAVFDIFGCADEEEFRELTGYTFRGMVYPEDYFDITDSILQQIAESEKRYDYIEYRIRRKDGSVIWVNDYGHYVENEEFGGLYYVFISDITKKHDQREKEYSSKKTIIKTLTRFYHTVWVIHDVETEQWSLYYAENDDKTIYPDTITGNIHKGSYSDDMVSFVNSMVVPRDRERILREMSIANILEQFKDKDQFSVSFLRQYDLETPSRYFQIDVGKLIFPDNRIGVTMGFKDIDKEYRAAQETQRTMLETRIRLQDELLEEQKHREEQDRIITALVSDYRSVYHVDLDADDAVCFRSDPTALDHHPEGVHFPFYEGFARYAELYIDKNYREEFLNFIDPKNIREKMLENRTFNYRYLIRRAGKEYYEMISLANVINPEGSNDNSVHAVELGLMVVDKEMRESIARNEALAQALAAAEEANKAKTAFLSNMSHEIRTPMNAIIGLANLALQDSSVSPKTHRYLEDINESAHHLLTLINDILDMSRIESGRLILRNEEFSFREMLEQLNTLVTSQCTEKGLCYECRIIGSVSDYYIGDDMKLKQVLINIMSNAIKFTDAPGEIILTIERAKVFEDQSTLRFCIKDTGIGIKQSFIPKIFESFSQENSDKNNKYGSTGLGMAITKNIIELMNGEISVKSEKGVGSEFTVVVTLKNSLHSESTAGFVKPRDMHVLIVDNDKIAAEHAQLVLGEMGVHADVCYNGEEALRMLGVQHVQNTPYNLVLMDWMMRSMDGLETSKRIRELYDRRTTVIILTSFNWDEIMDEALACGVDGFLAKPIFASNVINEFDHLARKNKIHLLKEKRRVELKGKRILMAEDVFINAEIMKQIIMMKDAEIDHAQNGKEAIKMFAESEPGYYAAILMDVRMPEMDGLEATTAIRALDRPDAQKVPIVAMTANAFDEDVQRSLQAGMNAHLSKPVEAEHLYRTLEELIWEAERM